jgi:hypothetical protein
MKILIFFAIILVLGDKLCSAHEFKGFTLKQFQFLYQIFTGEMDVKKKDKINLVKNQNSYYLGKKSN